jgi:hypothetical protein
MNCDHVIKCIAAWKDDDSPQIGPGDRPTGGGAKNAYWWAVEKVTTEYGQAMMCAQLNEAKCSGNMSNAPWRPGMPLSGMPMSDLPGFPDDAYYHVYQTNDDGSELGNWRNSNGGNVNWIPYYDMYCRNL